MRSSLDITDIVRELAALRETAASMREKLAKAEEQIADLRQDRDQWREAQRPATLPSPTPPDADIQRDRDARRDQAQQVALPKPDEKPMPWWRWLRPTG